MDKQKLYQLVSEKIDQKIQSLELLISETRQSNNDTKSSMGDKYETGREMLQQEINNLQIQLNEVLKQKNYLKTMSSKFSEKVEKGALVQTDKGYFYISVSLGEILFDSKKMYAISSESPLAIALLGKIKNEVVIFNNSKQKIENIW